jgi:hypothetical protein
MIEKFLMWFMLAAMCLARASARAHNGETVATEAHIAKRCVAVKRRVEVKKKARRINDAPSNKTYGNCLLGLHCIQKRPAANRAVARFSAVADRQHEKPCTGYPQMLVDGLGIVSAQRFRCSIWQNASAAGSHSTVQTEQSGARCDLLAAANIHGRSTRLVGPRQVICNGRAGLTT